MEKRKNLVVSIAIIGTITVVLIVIFLLISARIAYKQHENMISNVGLIQGSLIESVAAFDEIYSGSTYGESSSEATLFQIENSYSNMKLQKSGIIFVVVDLTGEGVVLLDSCYKTDDLDELNRLYENFKPLIKKIKENQIDVERVKLNSEKTVIADYRKISLLDIGLITYYDLAIYHGFVIRSVITAIGIMLIMLVSLILIGIKVIKPSNATMEKNIKRMEQFYRFRSNGIWEYDVVKDRYSMAGRFMNMLGYEDAPWELETLDDFLDAVHRENREEVRYAYNDLIYKNSDYLQVQFRLRRRDGEYVLIYSEAFVEVEDEYGYAVNIIGFNMLVADLIKGATE